MAPRLRILSFRTTDLRIFFDLIFRVPHELSDVCKICIYRPTKPWFLNHATKCVTQPKGRHKFVYFSSPLFTYFQPSPSPRRLRLCGLRESSPSLAPPVHALHFGIMWDWIMTALSPCVASRQTPLVTHVFMFRATETWHFPEKKNQKRICLPGIDPHPSDLIQQFIFRPNTTLNQLCYSDHLGALRHAYQ